MGLFGEGGGLSGLFGEGFQDRLAIAGALVNGDYGAASQIKARQAQMRAQQAEAEQQQQAAQAAFGALVKMGVPQDQAMAIASQPGAAASFMASRNQPKAPHYWEDNTGNLMQIGPDGKPQQAYQDPNPWKFIPNGMGGVVPVNVREYMGGGQQGGPAIGSIVPDPRKAGGPTGLPQSGGFPPF